MKDFFRSFFAALVALIVFTIIVFFLIGGIVSAFSKSFEENKASVKPNSVLRINVNASVPEQTQSGFPSGLSWISLNIDNKTGLNDILAAIKHAETDNNIKGIYLELGINENSYGTLQEIRDALNDFKKNSGKFIIGYGEVISQGSYFLASVGDAVYLNPSGAVEFKGLSAQVSFYKGTLDKLGINTQIFYDGKFKSATEPFRRTDMSEENRMQLREFLDELFDYNVGEIAASRNKSKDDYKNIANNLSGWYPSLAKQVGLVDGLKFNDEVNDEVKTKLGLTEKDSVSYITLKKYLTTFKKQNTSATKNSIAIVYADGDIIDGEGKSGYIGSKTFAGMMQDVRADENIKAVVLRVNSPGGSAVASDVMWREIEVTKKLKPVIVSMGDYAASGGYMISCNANKIFAQPNTLTGSIGVFLILPEISQFMENKIGVTFDTVKTSQYADFPTITRPVSENEKNILQAGVDSTYYNFKKMVAEGRNMTVEQVEQIAQGRIWMGSKAKELGLVDELGGIDEAMRAAADMVNLKEYTIVEYPKQSTSFFEDVFYNITNETEANLMQNDMGILYTQFKTVSALLKQPVMQKRLPYDMQIK